MKNEAKDIQITIHSTAYEIDKVPNLEGCVFITASRNDSVNPRDPFDYHDLMCGSPSTFKAVSNVTHIFVLPSLSLHDIQQEFQIWKKLFYPLSSG